MAVGLPTGYTTASATSATPSIGAAIGQIVDFSSMGHQKLHHLKDHRWTKNWEIQRFLWTWWTPVWLMGLTNGFDEWQLMLFHAIWCFFMFFHFISCYLMLFHAISCYFQTLSSSFLLKLIERKSPHHAAEAIPLICLVLTVLCSQHQRRLIELLGPMEAPKVHGRTWGIRMYEGD